MSYDHIGSTRDQSEEAPIQPDFCGGKKIGPYAWSLPIAAEASYINKIARG